jgi:hypothetical protein
MIATAGQTCDTQRVTALEPCNGSTAIRFSNGSTACLPGTHPDREVILLEARQSLFSGRPVGFVVDAASRLLDLHHGHDIGIHSVKDDEEDCTRASSDALKAASLAASNCAFVISPSAYLSATSTACLLRSSIKSGQIRRHTATPSSLAFRSESLPLHRRNASNACGSVWPFHCSSVMGPS